MSDVAAPWFADADGIRIASWCGSNDCGECDVCVLVGSARGARMALRNAQAEQTHGLTASAAFIERCIQSAADALDGAATAISRKKETQ